MLIAPAEKCSTNGTKSYTKNCEITLLKKDSAGP